MSQGIQLYTVNMTTKRLVSCFDEKGNKVSDYEDNIKVAFHDLPFQTAKMYETKNPGCVEIVAQSMTFGDNRKVSSKNTFETRSRSIDYGNGKNAAVAAAAKKNSINEAAQTGNLAAAINQR